MSAENAWRIAMQEAAEEATAVMRANSILCDPGWHVSRMDMPPAFRAAVEAETEELRKVLGRIRDETLLGASHGLGDRIYSIASAALSRLEAKGESHE